MVVGLSITITSGHAAMRPVRKFAPVITVAHRRSNVVAMPIIVTMVLVVMVVIVVNGVITVVMMMPRITIRHMVIRIVPAPSVVETVVIPIR